MASDGQYNHTDYSEQHLDVSDVVNLAGLNELVKNTVKEVVVGRAGIDVDVDDHAKRLQDEDEEMVFQTWTNGFLNDPPNDDEEGVMDVVDYYPKKDDVGVNVTSSNNVDLKSNELPHIGHHGAQNGHSSHNTNTSNTHRNDEDLAVQAVNQAVNQAVQAFQEEVDNGHSNNNTNSGDDTANVDISAVEDAVLNELKERDNSIKRSDRQLLELIQNAINNDKLVKQVITDDKSKAIKPKKRKKVTKSPGIKKVHIETSAMPANIGQEDEHQKANNSDTKSGVPTGDSIDVKSIAEQAQAQQKLDESVDEKISSISRLEIDTKINEAEAKMLESISFANSLIPLSMIETPSKAFKSEEKQAIDIFVTKYQEIENLSKQDFLNKIWSNERKKDKFWNYIQKVLPHRSRASIYKHVRRTYHVFSKRGVWTPEEDAQLRELYEKMNCKWKSIGEEMNRMPEDCRDRWRNYLKCGQERKTNAWSPEEEEMLNKIVTGLAGKINWTAVSEQMQGRRSRIQCRYKWNKLQKRAKC